MTTITTSTNIAKSIIKEFEGLRLTPYICAGGKLTIGYGHVLQKGQGEKEKAVDKAGEKAVDKTLKYSLRQISSHTAEQLLEQDIAKTRATVRKYTAAPLTIEQEAALISFTFNCGAGAFQASTLRQKLNRGEYELAANELLRWVHAGGVRLAGLVRRRAAERELFLVGSER